MSEVTKQKWFNITRWWIAIVIWSVGVVLPVHMTWPEIGHLDGHPYLSFLSLLISCLGAGFVLVFLIGLEQVVAKRAVFFGRPWSQPVVDPSCGSVR